MIHNRYYVFWWIIESDILPVDSIKAGTSHNPGQLPQHAVHPAALLLGASVGSQTELVYCGHQLTEVTMF